MHIFTSLGTWSQPLLTHHSSANPHHPALSPHPSHQLARAQHGPAASFCSRRGCKHALCRGLGEGRRCCGAAAFAGVTDACHGARAEVDGDGLVDAQIEVCAV